MQNFKRMFREIDKDELLLGVQNSLDNTWNNKYNIVTPNIEKNGSKIKYSTSSCSVEIDNFDEIILNIVLKYLFMPIWLIKQCYKSYSFIDESASSVDDFIESLVKVGLVYKESSVTGQYLRPTYSLFNLFNFPIEKYSSIPFNNLTHTISEEKIMFDIMSGENTVKRIILKNLKTPKLYLPRMSFLGLPNDINGTNVIGEAEFRNPILFTPEGINTLNSVENTINEAILNKKGSITPELENFRYFNIVKKIDNTGSIKKDYKFHIPDLAIPIPRINGQPNSIAIEVELTSKRYNYTESLERYKNNNKYGTVIWFCRDNSISNALKEAYKEIGGTGSCKCLLSEFIVPSPDY